ncbi:hypothetical protein B0A53_04031 [Rhodotorula sp. CCFEE 5036]|nr:hypothetical protein B0A53_04031 [Rhodotorula sp. CCFEE 5036]
MTTKTYFCYGVSVTNESITYATMAYPNLDGPFRFIRLVQKRIREGTLQTAPTSAAGLIPVEIWDLVRHKVTDLELRAAERGFLERKCRVLLHKYGLDMPSTRMLKRSPSEFCALTNGDPSTVAFIALSPTSRTDEIDADDHVSYEQPKVDNMDNEYNDGIWPVSLDKPGDADQRFRRLLRDLHLTPLRVSDGSIGIARATDTTGTRAYEKISAAEVQPQWHLFTTVTCDW